jgi:hypothetical protein
MSVCIGEAVRARAIDREREEGGRERGRKREKDMF